MPSAPDVGTISRLRSRLQRAMSRDAGVVRDAAGLTRAREELASISDELRQGRVAGDPSASDSRAYWELRNLIDAASAVVASAFFREESRGAHYRSDFPETKVALDGAHTLFEIGGLLRYGAIEQGSGREPSQ